LRSTKSVFSALEGFFTTMRYTNPHLTFVSHSQCTR